MKKINNIVILILLLIFIAFDLYIVLLNKTSVVYLGNYTKINIKNKNISITYKNKKINSTKAKIYFNNDFIDGYIMSNKSKLNNNAIVYDAYNSDGTILRFTDDLIAYTGNLKIEKANYNLLDLPLEGDFDIITQYLSSENGNGITLDYSIDYVDYKKVIYDLDNDGENEYIYSIQVVEEGITNYSYVFLVDEGETKKIYSCKGKIEEPKTKKVSFFDLIDFNDDGNYEIVIKIKDGEYGNSIYKLYTYDKDIKEIK